MRDEAVRDRTVRLLRCPVCAATLEVTPSGAACGRGHAFDLARQGYLNLTTGPVRHCGDTAAMVSARSGFLGRGHFAFIADALARQAGELVAGRTHPSGGTHPVAGTYPSGRTHPSGGTHPAAGTHPAGAGHRAAGAPLVVDAGAGTGYHLARVLDALPVAAGLALDVSKAAARRAARAHPRALAVVADTWGRLPVTDAAATLLLNVFAPRNGAEFRRVLRPDGALLVVTPGARHLHELVDALDLIRVDPAKGDRIDAALMPHLRPAGGAALERKLRLDRADVRAAVAMGPSAWHADPDRTARAIDALPEPITVTASVRLDRWRPA